MDSRIIVVGRPDGGVSMVTLAEGARGTVEAAPAVYAARVVRRAVHAWRVVSPAVPAGKGKRRALVRPEVTERVLVTPEQTEEVMVIPARMRPETDDEMVARILAQDAPVAALTEYTDPQGRKWPPGTLLRRHDAVMAGMPFDVLPAHVVDRAGLPAFRDAWTQDGEGKVSVDMVAARALHRAAIRAARAPLLAALDIAFTRAQGRNDQEEAERIEAERQKLRDATADPSIDAAATPEELKAVWPLGDGK